jgi:SAM-dependent methyltransferase
METKQKSFCELVNTYEALEHIMGINGLHPHSLSTIERLHNKVIEHTRRREGIILDIGCGSAYGTYNLSRLLPPGVSIIGIDINKAAIDKAQKLFEKQKNVSFFLGSLEEFYESHKQQNIIGIISVSVSMFLYCTRSYYQTAYKMLEEGGIFIDAPFVFKSLNLQLSEQFKNDTYQTCGCAMTMHTTDELEDFMNHANFKRIICNEREFELMNLSILFQDYSPTYLFTQFINNVCKPPAPLEHNSSWYLFRRTLGIFSFFLRNRTKFGATAIVGIK